MTIITATVIQNNCFERLRRHFSENSWEGIESTEGGLWGTNISFLTNFSVHFHCFSLLYHPVNNILVSPNKHKIDIKASTQKAINLFAKFCGFPSAYFKVHFNFNFTAHIHFSHSIYDETRDQINFVQTYAFEPTCAIYI